MPPSDPHSKGASKGPALDKDGRPGFVNRQIVQKQQQQQKETAALKPPATEEKSPKSKLPPAAAVPSKNSPNGPKVPKEPSPEEVAFAERKVQAVLRLNRMTENHNELVHTLKSFAFLTIEDPLDGIPLTEDEIKASKGASMPLCEDLKVLKKEDLKLTSSNKLGPLLLMSISKSRPFAKIDPTNSVSEEDIPFEFSTSINETKGSGLQAFVPTEYIRSEIRKHIRTRPELFVQTGSVIRCILTDLSIGTTRVNVQLYAEPHLCVPVAKDKTYHTSVAASPAACELSESLNTSGNIYSGGRRTVQFMNRWWSFNSIATPLADGRLISLFGGADSFRDVQRIIKGICCYHDNDKLNTTLQNALSLAVASEFPLYEPVEYTVSEDGKFAIVELGTLKLPSDADEPDQKNGHSQPSAVELLKKAIKNWKKLLLVAHMAPRILSKSKNVTDDGAEGSVKLFEEFEKALRVRQSTPTHNTSLELVLPLEEFKTEWENMRAIAEIGHQISISEKPPKDMPDVSALIFLHTNGERISPQDKNATVNCSGRVKVLNLPLL